MVEKSDCDESNDQASLSDNDHYEFLYQYRNSQLELLRESQDSYDKTVLTLSSGALGISFAFISDIVTMSNVAFKNGLYSAWILWGLSCAFVLIALFFGQQSFNKAIDQTDKAIRAIDEEEMQKAMDELYKNTGGISSTAVDLLNLLSGLFFVFGLGAMIFFVRHNL